MLAVFCHNEGVFTLNLQDIYLKFYLFALGFLMSFSLVANEEDRLYELARSSLNDHKYSEALIHVKNILKTSPEHLASHVLMAEILLESGSSSAAEVALTKAITLGANAKQLQLLFAKSYIQQGLYNKTLDFLPEHSSDNKVASKIYVLRGQAHLGLRQLKLSESDYRTALVFDGNNIDAKLGLAQVLVNYFQYRDADKLVDDALAGYVPPIKAWNLKASIQQSLGNNEAALKAINKALLIDKNNVQALIFASTINIELGDFDIAENYANQVLEKVPNEPKAEFIKAMIQVRKEQSGDSQEGMKKVAQVLDHLSEDVLRSNPSYYYLAGIILFHQQKYEAARQYIDSYLFVDENNINALTLAATIELIENNPLKAKILLNRANLVESDNPKILSMLGMTHLELKQYDKAHFFLEQVKALKPDSGIADTQLARNYLAHGNPNKAIEHLLTASAADFDPTIVGLLLVESYIKSGNVVKAINVAKNLAESLPNNANIQHHLGYIYQITGNQEQAKNQFDRALAIDSSHNKSIVSLAKIDFQNGKKNSAINRLKVAITKSENNIHLITTLASMYNYTENYAESVKLLEEKYKLDNKNQELLKHLTVSYAANNQLLSAIETLNSYLLNQRKTVDLYILLATLHIKNNDIKSAIDAYNFAIKEGGDKGQVFLLIADAQQKSSNIDEAIIAYKKSMAWDEKNEQAIVGLARLYNSENDITSAIELIKRFETQQKLSTELIEVLANSYLRTKQYSLAERYYKKRIKLEGNDSSVVGLNLVYRSTQRAEQAIKLLKSSLNTNNNSLLINTALAEVYIEQNQWQQADEVYQRLVEYYPSQPVILNNASYVALNLSNFQRAEELVKRSLAITDEQPDSLDTLGWIYYHTKQYNEALPLFRKALSINNNNPAVKYHLALTLKSLHRDKEAINLMVEVANSNYAKKAEADALLKEWLKRAQ